MAENETPVDYYPKQKKLVKAVCIGVVLLSYSFVEALLWFLSVFQFVWVLFTKEPNKNVTNFGTGLIRWNRAAIAYCLWKSDKPPFPFSSWDD